MFYPAGSRGNVRRSDKQHLLNSAAMHRLFSLLFLLCSCAAAQTEPCHIEAVLVGTGFPVPLPDRAGPSTAIIANGKYFIVDAGRGVTMRLAELKPRMPHIEAVFLTHLHSDHTSGLPDLFDTSWLLERRDVPFELYGPEGTLELANGMLQFLAADIHIRRDLTEYQPAAGATVNTHIVHQGVIYERDGLKITAFDVDHRPVVPAFGYRFDCGGKSIVISGDTGPSDNLVRFAEGADILIHEGYLQGFFDATEGKQVRVAQNLSRYHTTASQVGQIAARAHVKQLVITHVMPPDRSEAIAKMAATTFPRKITVGADLMRFSP